MRLSRALLDMDAETLTFLFSEFVEQSSLDVTSITLRNMCDGCAASFPETFRLTTNSTTESVDGLIIVVDLGILDMNEIKKLSVLAESSSTTYLALLPTVIVDMNNVPTPQTYDTDT